MYGGSSHLSSSRPIRLTWPPSSLSNAWQTTFLMWTTSWLRRRLNTEQLELDQRWTFSRFYQLFVYHKQSNIFYLAVKSHIVSIYELISRLYDILTLRLRFILFIPLLTPIVTIHLRLRFAYLSASYTASDTNCTIHLFPLRARYAKHMRYSFRVSSNLQVINQRVRDARWSPCTPRILYTHIWWVQQLIAYSSAHILGRRTSKGRRGTGGWGDGKTGGGRWDRGTSLTHAPV